ncbi:hypothetical protein Trydic_g23483 [Trypoxylus dichotomus]
MMGTKTADDVVSMGGPVSGWRSYGRGKKEDARETKKEESLLTPAHNTTKKDHEITSAKQVGRISEWEEKCWNSCARPDRATTSKLTISPTFHPNVRGPGMEIKGRRNRQAAIQRRRLRRDSAVEEGLVRGGRYRGSRMSSRMKLSDKGGGKSETVEKARRRSE